MIKERFVKMRDRDVVNKPIVNVPTSTATEIENNNYLNNDK